MAEVVRRRVSGCCRTRDGGAVAAPLATSQLEPSEILFRVERSAPSAIVSPNTALLRPKNTSPPSSKYAQAESEVDGDFEAAARGVDTPRPATSRMPSEVFLETAVLDIQLCGNDQITYASLPSAYCLAVPKVSTMKHGAPAQQISESTPTNPSAAQESAATAGGM
ncbi:hypothetical protein BU26DRAFT_498980 [Trematosphaeria pertusa]|uniref:Uncharacterized protein n=1 Tax=Trematosphaeria pertusa TaxID=390896 RepID=A0A6A6J0R8_9PLEO|nr:uncharacterized protein BU26DRAFT_498980 [Trematosphaeria pertusa]KAF2256289.1 hypothetical protein BU26DRAFT_498980 [Trematosphaeria pertusa]